jgi:hypothetical protein
VLNTERSPFENEPGDEEPTEEALAQALYEVSLADDAERWSLLATIASRRPDVVMEARRYLDELRDLTRSRLARLEHED